MSQFQAIKAKVVRAKKRPNPRIITGTALDIQWKITSLLWDLLNTGRTDYQAEEA
jgi:hypothetical protein